MFNAFFLSCAVALITLALTGTNIHFLFYYFQGTFAGPILLFGYVTVYYKFCIYHHKLLKKYDRIFSDQERHEVDKAKREVFKFFSYICQFLIMFLGFSLMSILYTYGKTASAKRWQDIIDVIFNVSYLLMLFGISDSIKRAVKTQIEHEKAQVRALTLIINPSGGTTVDNSTDQDGSLLEGSAS